VENVARFVCVCVCVYIIYGYRISVLNLKGKYHLGDLDLGKFVPVL